MHLKYVTQTSSGTHEFHMQVPAPLRAAVGKREIKKVLGTTEDDRHLLLSACQNHTEDQGTYCGTVIADMAQKIHKAVRSWIENLTASPLLFFHINSILQPFAKSTKVSDDPSGRAAG